MKAPAVMTAQQYREAMSRTGGSKYHNVRRVYEGQPYDSKAELAFEMRLRLLKAQGQVAFWLHQVPFRLKSGIVYRLDFLVMIPDRPRNCVWSYRPAFVDIKGYLTSTSRVKIREVEAIYGIKIELIKPPEVDRWE